MDESSGYREVRWYYPGGSVVKVPVNPPPPIPPRPGHGTVYIVQNNPDGTWEASWQDASCPDENGTIVGGVDDIEGDKETILQWAKSRPAEQILIFSKDAGDYIPLPS